MTSAITQHAITVGETKHLITVTAVPTENDYNGNPQWLVQVWTSSNNGHIWYPKVKGYRERKDDTYKVTGYQGIQNIVKDFVTRFELSLNDRL